MRRAYRAYASLNCHRILAVRIPTLCLASRRAIKEPPRYFNENSANVRKLEHFGWNHVQQFEKVVPLMPELVPYPSQLAPAQSQWRAALEGPTAIAFSAAR
jgi:hypothetical protein